MPEKPSAAAQRAAVPDAMEAAHDAQAAAGEAVEAAAGVSTAVEQAAERVESAAEALEATIADVASDLKSKSGTRLCPTCKGELIKHGDENPEKAGAYHCNACGTCWAPGLRHPR